MNPAKHEIGKTSKKTIIIIKKFIATRKIETTTIEEHQCSY